MRDVVRPGYNEKKPVLMALMSVLGTGEKQAACKNLGIFCCVSLLVHAITAEFRRRCKIQWYMC